MNREELKTLGLTEEQIDKVMAAHGKVVNGTKVELDTVTSERNDLKNQLKDRDGQLDDLSKQVKDNKDLSDEIDRLKEENKTATQDLQDKLDKQAFDFSLDKALSAAKVKNAKAVKALLDADKIKLDGEQLLGLDDQLKTIKESDGYLFADEQQEGGKPSIMTGQHGKGGTEVSTADFGKMSYKERIKLKQENPDQYNSLAGQ